MAEAVAPIDEGGGLAGLVCTAGVRGPIGSIGAVAPEELAAAIGINLIRTALALHHALPRLRARGGAPSPSPAAAVPVGSPGSTPTPHPSRASFA